MAHQITVPFLAVKLHLLSGEVVVMPLMESKTIFLNKTVGRLAVKYADRFQRVVLNKGVFQRINEVFPKGDFYKASVHIPFKAAKAGHYPDFELEFEYYFRPSDKGTWAVVPSLGIECYTQPNRDVENQVVEIIRMDFTRNRRLEMVQELVSSLWFEAIDLQTQDIQLNFPSLTDLEKKSTGTKERILPKVAKRIISDKREVYGRKTELEHLAKAIKGKFNKSVLLVGASGVGKTALVRELVRKNKRRMKNDFWETTASTLIKELTGDTGWQDSLAYLCTELAEQEDFLFVRNLMELFEVGQYKGNSVSMADFLKPYISRGELNLISECTEEELARIELRSPNYSSFFQIIRIEEPQEDLEEIIINKVKDIANLRKTDLDLEAIKETIRLNKRFTPYAGFPGKPIRFLESILLNQKTVKKDKINREHVIQYFCEETGMPDFLIDPDVPMSLKSIKTQFNNQLFGQELAVEKVVNLIGSVKTALTRTGKPIASFLFVGPTGVGKTEMAKILAQFTFGDREKIIRFDMSEYANPYAVTRLTGTSYQEDGLLTAAIRREPFCVLLFDEIEKADASFYDLLLQILGEGRLTDSRGHLVNFCSTIIIMTSNIGAGNLMNNTIGWKKEKDTKEVTTHFQSAVEKHFRPELVNRIDQVIPFEPLGQDTIRFVIEREVAMIRKREGVQFRHMDLFIEDEVLDYLTKVGFNTKYGARELQRTLREQLIIPLAKELNIQDYDDQLVVRFSMQDEKLHLSVEADELGLELLLEELEKINLADQASELRRNLNRLQESSSYLTMLSDYDMMEREKKRSQKAFFKNKEKSEKYTTALSLINHYEKLVSEIEALEMDLALQCMNLQNYQPAYIKKIEKWIEDSMAAKINLLGFLQPEENTCYINIYGSEPNVVFDFYQQLSISQDFNLSCKAILFDRTSKKEKESTSQSYSKRKLKNPDFEVKIKKEELLVGIEIKVEGRGAHLFFKEENGTQRWKLSDDFDHKYIVLVSPQEANIPEGIHRKEFYNKTAPRRVIEAQILKDAIYKINREVALKNQLAYIQKELEKWFKLNLAKALM